jgi:class 3 adenylate cyclase
LNSTNGTYLMDNFKEEKIQGKRITPSPATLKFGDTVASVSFGEFISTDSAAITQSLLVSSVEEIVHKRLFEALLVLDQCGSSSLADMEGDATSFHLKKRMFQLCDSVFKEHKPSFTKNTGDGFFATFTEAETCFLAARKIMRRIHHRNRVTQHLPIYVRIGLHAGETYYMDLTNMDRHGNDMNIAFRIEGVREEAFIGGLKSPLPEKDRIVASKHFLDLVPKEKDNFLLLGEADLKGIKESVELYLYREPS